MIITAMTLGTAWAVRGKFGHEQGAAWAGAIGGIIIVLLSGRKDWYQKIYTVALAAALGWGMGGMISYGIVVGYGRADDFPNAFYGLLMLFVIGGLYGLTGGGMLGLALAHTKEKKVDWPRLIVDITIGGFLFYGFFVSQIGWKMTPPRSEMWAGCAGAALAMLWFLHRNAWKAPLKVALFSMLGAGFGFASGNFLQTVIQVYEISFSGWNVMEYSIGFWGGLGMAYGVFTSKWEKPKTISNIINPVSSKIALLAVALFIPFIVWQQSFSAEKLKKVIESLGFKQIEQTTWLFQLIALILIVLMASVLFINFRKTKGKDISRKTILLFFVLLFGVYIVLSDLKTGSYFTLQHLEQKLYWVNFGLIFILAFKPTTIKWNNNSENSYKYWTITFYSNCSFNCFSFNYFNKYSWRITRKPSTFYTINLNNEITKKSNSVSVNNHSNRKTYL